MWFSKYKKSDYSGGFCLEDNEPIVASRSLKAVRNFVAPRRIDNRDMCLRSSNQGNLPHCSGYGTAGYIEVFNWRTKHYPEQIDGSKIYEAAKLLDGMPNVQGSNLRSAANGAINLGLIKGEYQPVGKTINDIKFAIHEYGTVILGFRITSEWNLVDSKTGKISISNNPTSLGGHCILGAGFDEEGLYIQNSWGDWGIYGFAIIPWQLFSLQLMDACVIVPEIYRFEHQK
jgi:hypothetical protein